MSEKNNAWSLPYAPGDCNAAYSFHSFRAHLDTATNGARTVPVRSRIAGGKAQEYSRPPRSSDVLRAGTARAPVGVSRCALLFRDVVVFKKSGSWLKLVSVKVAIANLLLIALAIRACAAEATSTNRTAQQRLETPHLQAVHEARLRFARERQTLPNLGVYDDFRAVLHVHAEDSDHTKGTRQQVLEAAKKVGVRIVMFTDHGGPKPETWHGLRDGVLFVAGEENGGAGLLRFPNFAPDRTALPEGELRFLSPIEERYDASSDGFAGMEISNRHTDAKLDASLQSYLLAASTNPDRDRKSVV